MTGNTKNRDLFYFYSFVVMAILCLGGFVPTFYLRPVYHTDPLPIWMHFHGVIYTLWYLIGIVQAWLILKNKRVLHQELGVVAAIVAFSAFIITFVGVAYLIGTGGHATGGAKFSLILTTGFTLCIAVAIYYRRKTHLHRQLMLIGTALLTIPGFDRLLRIIIQPSVPDFSTPDAQKIVLGCGAVYFAYMLYREIKQFGRPTVSLPVGFACIALGGFLGASFGDTATWSAMVTSFGSADAPHHVPH